MSDNIISFLREHCDKNKIELNECIALMSKYFIEGGDGIEDFPKFERELNKFTSINPKRSELDILIRWWDVYTNQQKLTLIEHKFSIIKGMVVIPKIAKVETNVETKADIQINNLFDKLELLYDKLVSNRGGVEKVSAYKYIWQWGINTQDYEAICQFVKEG